MTDVDRPDGDRPDPDRPDDARPGDDALVAEARPGAGDLAHAVVRARAAAALFGVAAAVTIGRYRVLARLGGGGGGEVWSAWDPELDRRVALKLIDTAASSTLRDRVRAEGQALARLSHPNVVPVHDVIDHGEHVVLVMEYVDGSSLRSWVTGRPAREVVRGYRQLADGLAAMHAAGMVHRDVKPDNAMVGADGRVRVVDLGLAVTAEAGTGATGAVAGTPRYMAPEQAAGERVTAAVDQFGLCASLREALTRDGAAAPPWLAPILERGTRADPAARFPSMTALAAALATDPARRRWQLGLATGAVAAVAVAFAVGRSAGATSRAGAACDGGGPAVARIWNDARRAAVRAGLAAHGTRYSEAAAPALIARLDDYAAAWAAQYDGACRAHATGAASPSLAERRARCLAQAGAALDAVVTLADGAGADDLPDLAQAAAALPSLARCADDDALLADLAPAPAAIAAAAAALDDRLAAVRVHLDASRPDAATRAAAALADARALAYPPLLARALVLDGRAGRRAPDHGAARFAEAVGVALAAGDDTLAVEAFARQVWAASTAGADAAAPDGVALVQQLAARLADGRFARALLGNNLGVAALAHGDRDGARRAFTGALAEADGVTGPDAAELLVLYANLALVTDDDTERRRLLDQLLARRTAALGAEHPRTLDVRITQGMLATDLAEAARLLEGACGDLARFHPQAGSDLGDCWFELALVAEQTGRPDAARAALDRTIATATTGGDEARIELARAGADRLDGRLPASIGGFTRLVEALGDPGDRWWIGVQRAEALLGRAQAERALGRTAAAAADAATAATELDAIDARQRLPWIARRATLARALTDELTTRPGSPR